MRTVLILLILIVGLPHPAAAQQSDASHSSRSHSVVFSATGGTSKGSYQGGHDWVISEFLRRQRADPTFRQRLGLPWTLELKAATGASAGNVNALVAALAWCTKELKGSAEIAAEKSLFWTFWVNTGIDQLMPSSENPEHAVFDRSFFLTDHWKALSDFVERDTVVWDNCWLPVGITMTKQTPAELNLSEGSGLTRVQRFAAVFETNTLASAATPKRLTIEPPRGPLPTSGGLGALALPPSAASCPQEEHGLKWAFNVMIASSSFPVAFAPRRVCYEAGGLVTDGVQRAMFSDGGVFDNNPAGLALGLADYVDKSRQLPLSDTDVLYTSGSNTRGALREARESAAPQQDLLGLAGTRQLLVGGITSARDYEMQTVMRQRVRDEDLMELKRKVEFVASSRSGEIVGETLAGFGAFLAREFREYDFYAGIYDGLDYMANYVCERRPAATRCDRRSLVSEWIAADFLRLSPEAHLVVQWRQALEQSPGVPMRRGDWQPRLDTVKKKLLFAIHTQIANLAARRPEIGARSCATRNDIVGNWLCTGGLDTLLYGLKSDEFVKDARANHSSEIDPALNELLHAPETRVNGIAEGAMNRLHRAEEQLQKTQREYGSWVETALLVYRGQSYRYRKGLKWNPSSGRFDFTNVKSSAASVANIVFPNYLTLGVGRSDLYTFGWRPLVWRPRQSVYLGTIGEFTNLEGRKIAFEHNTVGVTIGTYAPPLPIVTSIEVGVLSSRLEDPKRQTFISTSFRFLADKLHLNVRVRPSGKNRWLVNLGISDFNGIVYWLLR